MVVENRTYRTLSRELACQLAIWRVAYGEQVRSGDLLKPRSSISGIDQGKSDRRRSFLGAYDKEVPLRMYVDSVRAKWERNGNLIYEKRSIGNTELSLELAVTIKSDGSVEEVSVIKSSGNRATDERARNIAITNAPYSAFPPALAAKYGVIEVKHVWIFLAIDYAYWMTFHSSNGKLLCMS